MNTHWRRGDFLLVGIVVLLAKLMFLVVSPTILMAGTGQDVVAAQWSPHALSSIYPAYAWLTATLWPDVGQRVTGLLLAQVLSSATSAGLLYWLLRRQLRWTAPVCVVLIASIAFDPAQWASERTALPDTLARLMVVLAIVGWLHQTRDAKWRWALLWIPASGLAALLDPALDWLVVALGLLLSVPMSRRFHQVPGRALVASNRWSSWAVWLAGLLAVTLVSQNAVHALHGVFGLERSAVEIAGAQRVTAWASMVTPEVASRYGLDLEGKSPGAGQGFEHWSDRAQSLYGANGLWAALRQQASRTGMDPQMLARKLAARSLQNDPSALGGILRESLWPSDTEPSAGSTLAWPVGRRLYGLVAVLGVVSGFAVAWRLRRAKRIAFRIASLAAIQLGLVVQLGLLNPDISLAKSAWYSFFGLPLIALTLPRSAHGFERWWRKVLRESLRVMARRARDARQWLASDSALQVLQWPVVVIAVGAAVWLMGQDRNWDLLNYHLYNPLALWQGRPLDVVPAQLQSWYSPFLDLPAYWLATSPVSGYWVALWLSLPAMFALGLLWRIAVEATAGWPLVRRWVSVVVVVAMAATASAGSASLGTTFNEWPIAAAVVFSLWVLLRMARTGEVKPWALFMAAFVPGAITGLKLTGAPYCFALGAAAWVALPPEWRWRGMGLFMLAGMTGGVLTIAPWAIHVWRETGNPLFPYYNQWFQSPDALPLSYVFSKYRPESFWAALRSPWDLASGSRWFSEVATADGRLLLGWLVVIGGVFAPLRVAPGEARRAMGTVAAFFVVGYVAWLQMHAIHRYTIPLEITAGLLLLIWLGHRRATGMAVLIVVMAGLQLFTLVPNWGRTAFTTPFARNLHPAYPEHSALVMLSGSPLGYVAVDLPAEVPLLYLNNNLVRVDECRRWQREGLARLEAAKHVWLVQSQVETMEVERQAMQRYGLRAEAPCSEVASSLRPFWLCPVEFNPRDATICSGAADGAPRH